MNRKQLLAHSAGMVDQQLPLRNEHFAAENRVLSYQLKGRLRLRDGERILASGRASKIGSLEIARCLD